MLQKTPLNLTSKVKGISHVVVDVADLAAAEKFYAALGLASVGRDRWPGAGAPTATFKTGSGQYVVLAQGPARNDPRISAAHHAYSMSAAARAKLVEALTATGVSVHRFHEDRPAEADDNFYVDDPSGNRIQLVARDGVAVVLDHVGLETNNILWSREFYQGWFGFAVEHRVGWKTSDYLAAKSLGEKGMEAAMPGSRYWNERYSQFETEKKALRPCPQLYFTLGGGTSLAVYLASRQYQAPRDDALRGTPCLGLATTDDGLKEIADFLRAQGREVEGPVHHGKEGPLAASLYLKDAGSNFVEFCVVR